MSIRRIVVAGLIVAWTGVSIAAEHVVEIRDHQFAPATLTIKRGDTIRWINLEKRTSHSVLLLEPITLESERLFPGESWTYRFEQSGEHAYRCGPHPEMLGKALVQP